MMKVEPKPKIGEWNPKPGEVYELENGDHFIVAFLDSRGGVIGVVRSEDDDYESVRFSIGGVPLWGSESWTIDDQNWNIAFLREKKWMPKVGTAYRLKGSNGAFYVAYINNESTSLWPVVGVVRNGIGQAILVRFNYKGVERDSIASIHEDHFLGE